MTIDLKEEFNKIDIIAFHYYLACKLIEYSVNPKTLEVEKLLGPKEGVCLRGSLKISKDNTQYFIFRLFENELSMMDVNWLKLAADRAAFKLRDSVFPGRWEWLAELENKIYEMETSRKNDD